MSEATDHKHSWAWYGSDPYLICECGAIQDALTGRTIRTGATPEHDLADDYEREDHG